MEKEVIWETVGELFCGPGGSGLGASMSCYEDDKKVVRMRHLWATDYDKDSCETYDYNIHKFEREKLGINSAIDVRCEDINSTSIDLNEPKDFPKIDGLIFGFPCNDFSIVGESKGLAGQFGPLYKHGIKVLTRPDKPKWFIAENVSGLSSANNGTAFEQIKREMSDAGYNLTVKKYKFEDYGVPQSRHRIIIVGIRDDLNIKFDSPNPITKLSPKTSREALEGIPTAAPNQEKTKQSKHVTERLKNIKPGQNAWNSDLPPHLKLNVPRAQLSHIYKRLDPDKPAYTVTGSGGGGTHMYHWNEPRALTNRERARLQTFPDDFEFKGSKESVRKQIGMAIPPKGLKVICNALLKQLYKTEN